MADEKKLPIGVEYFKDFKYDNFYYVDKTKFISSLLNTRGIVNLFTRPRRFGKSLNMDMLKTFFEIGTDLSLFKDLEIAKDTKICEQYSGKYPVISISLKDVSGASYADALKKMSRVIKKEARRHQYLLNANFSKTVTKQRFIMPIVRMDIKTYHFITIPEQLSISTSVLYSLGLFFDPFGLPGPLLSAASFSSVFLFLLPFGLPGLLFAFFSF